MTDFAVQRRNMVESQIRPNDVTDRAILAAMLEVPREMFVPASQRPLAYADAPVPVAGGTRERPRMLATPMVLAKLIQLAEVRPSDLVLDVGCATGYSTALLARLADAVVGLECDPGLAERASKALAELGVDNAAILTGSLEKGCPEEGPYDVIVLNGSVPEVPKALLDQLKDNGRVVAVIARSQSGFGKATLIRRIASGTSHLPAFDAALPPLPGFERAPAFSL